MSGVVPVHVQRGIRLRIALRLRGAHGGIKVHALDHFGEDKIAGAIEDAEEARDAIAHEPFAQHLDDGHAPGHAGFVI